MGNEFDELLLDFRFNNDCVERRVGDKRLLAEVV